MNCAETYMKRACFKSSFSSRAATFHGLWLHLLAKTDPNPPTANLCFNILFHLYFHDLVLDEPIATVTGGVTTYKYPDIDKLLCFMFFGYLYLAETDTCPPTHPKSTLLPSHHLIA